MAWRPKTPVFVRLHKPELRKNILNSNENYASFMSPWNSEISERWNIIDPKYLVSGFLCCEFHKTSTQTYIYHLYRINIKKSYHNFCVLEKMKTNTLLFHCFPFPLQFFIHLLHDLFFYIHNEKWYTLRILQISSKLMKKKFFFQVQNFFLYKLVIKVFFLQRKSWFLF